MTYTWDSSFEASPLHNDAMSQADDRIRGLKGALRERLAPEHYIYTSGAFDTNTIQGLHRQGSALAYYAATAPTNRPDGTALGDDNYSNGRLWIKSSNGALYYYGGASGWKFFQALPINTVIFYADAGWVNNSTIPGWYQCDGLNGTIDLSDKFIVAEGTTYTVADTDAAPVHHHTGPSHAHTMVAHNHTMTAHDHGIGSHTHGLADHSHNLTTAYAMIYVTVSNFPALSRSGSFTANNAGFITHTTNGTVRSAGVGLGGATDGSGALTTDTPSADNTASTTSTSQNTTSTMGNAGDGDTGDSAALPPYYCLIAIERIS